MLILLAMCPVTNRKELLAFLQAPIPSKVWPFSSAFGNKGENVMFLKLRANLNAHVNTKKIYRHLQPLNYVVFKHYYILRRKLQNVQGKKWGLASFNLLCGF